jgi:hypothetical protein
MSYLDILQAIKYQPIVRLGVSKIPNAGIGVFAVTNISKDMLLFKPIKNYILPWQTIPEPAVSYLTGICNVTTNGVILDCEPNKIYSAYYINHSNNPNLHHDLTNDEYWSIRDIKEGEELTCFYLPNERDWNVSES